MRLSGIFALSAVGAVVLSACSVVEGDKNSESAPAAPITISAAPQKYADGTVATVEEVKNGNTLAVTIEGTKREVRLADVLAPHKRNADLSGSCLIDEATQFTRDLLPAGTEITLSFDPESVGTSGFIEAAVHKGDQYINRAVVAEGYGTATYLSYNDKFYQEISAAQLEAAQAHKGIYSPDIECSIPHTINKEIAAVDGAHGLEEKDAKQIYRHASDTYNSLQRSVSNPASWAGSIVTLDPIREQLQKLKTALGDNYYDQNGVRLGDKISASAAPVRPGGAPLEHDHSVDFEPSPTAEPSPEKTYSDQELADTGLVPVETQAADQ